MNGGNDRCQSLLLENVAWMGLCSGYVCFVARNSGVIHHSMFTSLNTKPNRQVAFVLIWRNDKNMTLLSTAVKGPLKSFEWIAG